jgi:hypothetical protein
MPFDANLVLADDTLDWDKTNLDLYGTGATSLTKNAGGFVVIDLGAANIGGAVSGMAAVLVLTEAANAAGDALTVTIQESDTLAFTVPHELCKFDILAATLGIIIGSETPCTVVKRISPTLRYIRCLAACTASDDFKTCWCLLSPYPYKVL